MLHFQGECQMPYVNAAAGAAWSAGQSRARYGVSKALTVPQGRIRAMALKASQLVMMVTMLFSCAGAGGGRGNCSESLLRQHAMNLRRKCREGADMITPLDSDFAALLRSGSAGVPWIFRAAMVEMPRGRYDEHLVLTWAEWAWKVRMLELDEHYVAMFPSDPCGDDVVKASVEDAGYWVVWPWPSLEGTVILNPVMGYERVNGVGTWPRDVDLPVLKDSGARAPCEKEILFRLCAQGLERSLRYEGQLWERGMPPDMEDGLIYNRKGAAVGFVINRKHLVEASVLPSFGGIYPPPYIRQLLKAGPAALPAVFRVWVESRNCRFLEVWDRWFRDAIALGFIEGSAAAREAIEVERAAGIETGVLLVIAECEQRRPGTSATADAEWGLDILGELQSDGNAWPDTRNDSFDWEEPYSWNGSFDWAGREDVDSDGLYIVNPIVVYEEVFGRGSWPRDITKARICGDRL